MSKEQQSKSNKQPNDTYFKKYKFYSRLADDRLETIEILQQKLDSADEEVDRLKFWCRTYKWTIGAIFCFMLIKAIFFN